MVRRNTGALVGRVQILSSRDVHALLPRRQWPALAFDELSILFGEFTPDLRIDVRLVVAYRQFFIADVGRFVGEVLVELRVAARHDRCADDRGNEERDERFDEGEAAEGLSRGQGFVVGVDDDRGQLRLRGHRQYGTFSIK